MLIMQSEDRTISNPRQQPPQQLHAFRWNLLGVGAISYVAEPKTERFVAAVKQPNRDRPGAEDLERLIGDSPEYEFGHAAGGIVPDGRCFDRGAPGCTHGRVN